jgi:hypothetical protein
MRFASQSVGKRRHADVETSPARQAQGCATAAAKFTAGILAQQVGRHCRPVADKPGRDLRRRAAVAPIAIEPNPLTPQPAEDPGFVVMEKRSAGVAQLPQGFADPKLIARLRK